MKTLREIMSWTNYHLSTQTIGRYANGSTTFLSRSPWYWLFRADNNQPDNSICKHISQQLTH